MKIFFTKYLAVLKDNGNIGGSISFHVENSFTEVIIRNKGPTTICSYWFDIYIFQYLHGDVWYYN